MGNKRNTDVLIVGSYPPPFGGQSVHIQNLHAHLKAKGFAVNVLNTGATKDIRTSEIESVRDSRGLLRALLYESGPRLVHVHVSGVGDFGKLLPVWVASFIRRFRVVVTVHAGNIEKTMQTQKALKALLVRAILSRVDRVICVNETIRTVLSRWTRKESLAVIPAFSLEQAEGKVPKEVEDFIGRHDPLITCVGFCEPVYGFDLAIQAIKKLAKSYDSIGLVIMGDKRGGDRYEALIEEHRVGNHILLCGNLSHDECLSVMKRSSLFLRPTLYDGDAISVREALAMKLPVVASNTEFRPAGVEVFKSGDFEDMLKRITLCLKKPGGKTEAVKEDLSNLEDIRRLYASVMTGAGR